MGLTAIEKVFRQRGDNPAARPGDTVYLYPEVAMIHEGGTFGLIPPITEMGAEKIVDSIEVVCMIDHFVPAPTVAYANMHKATREFAKKMKIRDWYEIGRGGICHQLMPEKGHVRPGELLAGTDAHMTTYGAFGACSIGVGWTDMAVILATGKMWAIVPESVKIILTGKLGAGVSSKDIVLHFLREFGESSLTYKAIEVEGPGLESLSVDDRMTICNMSSEMDIKTIIMKPDQKVMDYVHKRTNKPFAPVWSDDDAVFEKIIEFDISKLEPLAACPHSPSNVRPVTDVAGKRIDQSFIGSCTNGRLSDLRDAWSVLKGHQVHPDVRMVVTPASQEVFLEAVEEGLIKNFMEAGAVVTNPNCGACIGGHMGLLADGEVCAATSNRNYPGRMGSIHSEIFLMSPFSAAAAAVAGMLADPRDYLG